MGADVHAMPSSESKKKKKPSFPPPAPKVSDVSVRTASRRTQRCYTPCPSAGSAACAAAAMFFVLPAGADLWRFPHIAFWPCRPCVPVLAPGAAAAPAISSRSCGIEGNVSNGGNDGCTAIGKVPWITASNGGDDGCTAIGKVPWDTAPTVLGGGNGGGVSVSVSANGGVLGGGNGGSGLGPVTFSLFEPTPLQKRSKPKSRINVGAVDASSTAGKGDGIPPSSATALASSALAPPSATPLAKPACATDASADPKGCPRTELPVGTITLSRMRSP